MSKRENVWGRLGSRLPHFYLRIMTALLLALFLTTPALAVTDLFTVADTIIVDLYNSIAGISTAKVDQAWDWLKRIWICWAIINGIGAFIAYIVPKFSGLATVKP